MKISSVVKTKINMRKIMGTLSFSAPPGAHGYSQVSIQSGLDNHGSCGATKTGLRKMSQVRGPPLYAI